MTGKCPDAILKILCCVAVQTSGKCPNVSLKMLKRWCWTAVSPGQCDWEDNVTVSSYTWNLNIILHVLYNCWYDTCETNKPNVSLVFRNVQFWHFVPADGLTGEKKRAFSITQRREPNIRKRRHGSSANKLYAAKQVYLTSWSCSLEPRRLLYGKGLNIRVYSVCENLPTATRSRILCGSLLKVEGFEMCKWIC